MADVDAKKVCGVPERVQLHVAMLALQFGYAGFHVVSRAALNMGISKVVFPVYRNIIALILLDREGADRPTRWDREADGHPGLRRRRHHHYLVQGADHLRPLPHPERREPGGSQSTMLWLGDAKGKNWTLGCLYLIGHCLSWSGWLVLQAPVLKKYPARLSVTSYTCFFGVIQFLVIAAFIERDAEAWMFHSGSELFTILYAGFVASGIAFAVQIWCIDRGGPVFVAVYQPVQTLVVAIMASIFLGEEFYLGGY
ncbi:hypothetical protein B296_00035270 [Ensete ventricosum]|uniref:WAT1-related protein n=1 Tax=Ensete ventricosum TaxID=4639 RepID=A0A426Z7E3_ENSVE|nr:hypothetical protein B296_00035270 [Ensete ventricosum]